MQMSFLRQDVNRNSFHWGYSGQNCLLKNHFNAEQVPTIESIYMKLSTKFMIKYLTSIS